MSRSCSLLVIVLAAGVLTAQPSAVNPDPNTRRPIEALDTVFLEEMTWMEVRDALKAGKTTVIVPTGGVEQNGPYLATGKHNTVLRGTTEAIARKLGNALVAPIVAFVPEGGIDPPTGHMKYPGTISLSEDTYQRLLTDICASLRAHGFEHLVLLGDSGGNQKGMKEVAARLDVKWAGGKTRVHFIPEYYDYPGVTKWLERQGIKQVDEGLHDDFAITAQMMAVDPTTVRMKQRQAAGKFRINGIDLTPAEKTIAWGKKIIDFRAETTVRAIRKALAPAIPPETPAEAKRRHERVALRRGGTDVICHRGASEHAHENTLEAFRATFELGGDGNEFDIRATKDGVLVVFHDDMLDRRLEAYGDVGDYRWEELRRFRFRDPGRFGAQCRIPTLVEVFDLHRQYGGLMHLDIKRPGLDGAIAELLTRMDLWDHVAYCNTETGGVILRDPRLRLRRYKAGLYLDRSEVFPDAIAMALKKPGDGVIVDDPRGVAVALGRKPGNLSGEPVAPRPVMSRTGDANLPGEVELIALLRKADDWDRVAETAADRAASGERIVARARAADQLLAVRASSQEAFAALEERVRKRSLHKEWMYHGLDGAIALRSLILLRAPNAVETARLALWRDDSALEPVLDPRWKNPRAWTDFRVKMVIFPALEKCPGPATEQLSRDYLALDDEGARRLGPPQFEEAARALLAVSPRSQTALELMKHRLQVVRGRAILDCLTHATEAWAREALEKGAPHALAFRIGGEGRSSGPSTLKSRARVEASPAEELGRGPAVEFPPAAIHRGNGRQWGNGGDGVSSVLPG